MEYVILLDKYANIREVEAEEQTRFVISIIEALEVPFEWDSNEPFSVLDKIRLRKVLGQYNISVIDDMEGGVKIYLERDIIAEWKKPLYLLKEDPSQIDHKKKLYIEMKCCFSSMFEEQGETT
jgi:hypothetical protein